MKLLTSIKKVNQIGLSNNHLICSIKENTDNKIISDGDAIYEITGENIHLIVNKKVYYFFPFNDGILFNTKPETEIKYYDFSKTIDVTESIYHFSPLSQQFEGSVLLSKSDKNSNSYYFLFKESFKLKNLPDYYQLKIDNIFFRYFRKKGGILAFQSPDFSQIWQTNIRQYGTHKARHTDTGEILYEKDNEIHHAPLAFDNLLIVPLTGGQLVALDVKNGEKVWMYDENKIFGAYELFGNKIYKSRGLSIKEIDARTGQFIREKNFKEDSKISDFHATGEFLVYEDVIILKDSPAKIVILDRKTFKVKDYIKIDTRLASSKNNIIWHNNHLYVLDVPGTLHVYE